MIIIMIIIMMILRTTLMTVSGVFQCKCAQYWPDQGCWTYGNIRVSVEDMTVLVDYTIRKFCIQQVLDLSNSIHTGSNMFSYSKRLNASFIVL